jgi:sugar lactone lactonase YvrE
VSADDPPQLKRILPNTITAGAPQFTVRIEGKRFGDGAVVLFDGSPLDSSRVVANGKLMLAEVPASAVATAGTHTIAARNPDGATTPEETLSVVESDPDFIIRLETTASQEGSQLTTIPSLRSEGLSDSDKILVWGKSQAKNIQDHFAQFAIPNSFLGFAAQIPINVRDKKGNYSNTEIYFVVPRPATITFIDPDSIEVGDEDFQLLVHGDFGPDAAVVINDTVMPTTVGKNGRLEVMVPAAFRAQPSQLVVRVDQSGIQSINQILTVTPTTGPFIYTIAPATIRVGEGRATIDIVGANFNSDTTAQIDGADAKIKSQTKRRLTVLVPSDLLSVPGGHTVQAFDKDGNPTDSVSFKIVPDVTVSTLVGSSRGGFNSETCVPGELAMLRRPRRLSFGPDGLIYFTDQQNHAIRTLDPSTLQVCTIAGALGEDGYNDSDNDLDKPPTFSFPNGVAVTPAGIIFVSENGNTVIRRIERTSTGIDVQTFAGTFREVTDHSKQKSLNSTKIGIDSYRDSTLLDSSFRLPDDMLVAPDGSIYIADAGNHAIRRIVEQGGQIVVETVAGNGVPGYADGEAENARFNTPTAIALSPDNQFLFVADTNNGRIRRIDLVNKLVRTYAGSGNLNVDDGPAPEAGFIQPIGLAVDSNGIVYVTELGASDIRRIEPSGDVSTLAGGDNSKFRDGPGVDAKFAAPRGLLLDRANGILYVADYENMRIRKVTLP